jgi:L-asparaginase
MLQEDHPLAGIVAEGLAPYAALSGSQERALLRAAYRGIPVVKTAVRLNPTNLFSEGNNLTATKARFLLTAAIMKLGALPHAADPERPTPEELDAIRKRIAAYQDSLTPSGNSCGRAGWQYGIGTPRKS